MFTMRDATGVYHKRYYGEEGVEIGKKIRVGINDVRIHDMFHIIASGIISDLSHNQLNDSEAVIYSLESIENAKLVNRIVGAEAETLQKIYRDAFNAMNSMYYSDGNYIMRELKEYYITFFDKMKSYNSAIDNGQIVLNEGNLYSHIPAVNEFFISYNDANYPRFLEFFSMEQIEFHLEKAKALYNKLYEEHPECVNPERKLDYEKLLDIGLCEFKIDNFMAVEKEKLRSTSRVSSIGRGIG